MEQNELRIYEAAFTLCLGNKDKGLETVDAINNVVQTMGPLVSDAEDLREYLYREVSFSSNDIASMLSADDRKGKDKEWWNNLRQTSGFKGTYWNRYKAYLSGSKKWSQKTIEKSINEPTDFVMNCISNPNSGVPEKSYGAVFGYVQIDTYGSPTREMKDKLSQSIQVDKEMAKELIKLMVDTFDILD